MITLLSALIVFVNGHLSGKELALVGQVGKHGYIDQEGTYVIEMKYDKAKSFVNGWARVMKGSQWLFVNKDGKEIGPKGDVKLHDLSEGLTHVLNNSTRKFGYIDETGKWVLEPTFDHLEPLFNRRCRAYGKKIGWGYLNSEGQ